MQRCWRVLTITTGAAVTSCKQINNVCFTFISSASFRGSRNVLATRHKSGMKLYRKITHLLTVKLTLQQVLSLYVHILWRTRRASTYSKDKSVTCTADSGADSLGQKGAVGLSDWLRAANQIQSSCCSCPGQTHETGHSGGEVTHLHGLEKKPRKIFHT